MPTARSSALFITSMCLDMCEPFWSAGRLTDMLKTGTRLTSLSGRWAVVPVLWFLAAATLATTVQRMVHVAAKLPGPRPRDPLAGSGGDADAAASQTPPGETPTADPQEPQS